MVRPKNAPKLCYKRNSPRSVMSYCLNKSSSQCGGELLVRKLVGGGFSTDPDILRLTVNCSHMSDASKVSWGPTKPSNCSQKSLVSSTEAAKRRRRDKVSHYGTWAEESHILALNEQQNGLNTRKHQNSGTLIFRNEPGKGKWKLMASFLVSTVDDGAHLPLIIKQAAALMAWKRADQCR